MHLLKEEDALDEREIGRKFSDSRAFMAMPVLYNDSNVSIEVHFIIIKIVFSDHLSCHPISM